MSAGPTPQMPAEERGYSAGWDAAARQLGLQHASEVHMIRAELAVAQSLQAQALGAQSVLRLQLADIAVLLGLPYVSDGIEIVAVVRELVEELEELRQRRQVEQQASRARTPGN